MDRANLFTDQKMSSLPQFVQVQAFQDDGVSIYWRNIQCIPTFRDQETKLVRQDQYVSSIPSTLGAIFLFLSSDIFLGLNFVTISQIILH